MPIMPQSVSPEQFGQLYHGTASRMRPGSQITPGRPTNYPGVTLDTGAEHVFATDDITEAWGHAQNASAIRNEGKTVYRRGMSPDETGEDPEYLPRPVYRPSAPRVYPVSPTGPMQVDQEQTQAGYEPADPEDYDFDGDRATAFQSKHPLEVTGRDVGREAQGTTVSEFGGDSEPRHPSNEINNAVGVHETYPQLRNLNKRQFGGYY